MNLHNRKVKIALAILIAIVAIITYRIYSNIQNDKARAAKMGEKKAVNVTTAHAERQTIIPVLKFSGTLDPEWQAEVGSKVDGRLEHVYVHEGDVVHKGQLLAILEQVDTDANLINAQGAYRDAEINLRNAQQDYERYAKLGAQGAIPQEKVDDMRFAMENAAAKLESARGTLQGYESKAQGTKIIAPQDGIIAKRYYQEGYYAKAATPIFAIADIRSLKITIHIPEGNIQGVAVGNKAQIALAAYKDKKLEGTITRIAPVADTPSHTFEAEVSVPNGEHMRAGVYATVTLKGTPRENALVIPIQAIIMRDDQKTLFVPDAKGYVQRRVIDVGYMDDKVAEVLNGLDESDTFVLEGHNKLREGSQIKLEQAGK